MSVASERQQDDKPLSAAGGGIPYQAIATWALTAVIALVSWVFLSTTSDIKSSIDKQGDDIKALRKEVAENHLELVRRTDAIDKDVALANVRLDAVAYKVGAVQPQSPTPAPQQGK